jgi:hypothetical protein
MLQAVGLSTDLEEHAPDFSRKRPECMDTEVIPQQTVPLWRNRDYLLLWLGQAVSSLGTGFTQFAFPLLMVGLTHSLAAAGLAYGLEQLPYALFSLPAGALVDC